MAKIQNIIGHPPLQKFLRLLRNNHIPNCPVTAEDAIAAEDIYGTN